MSARVGALIALSLLAGCEDVRRFAGTWAGPVSADPQLREGFPPMATLRATIASATRHRIDATLDLPGMPGALPFRTIEGAAADTLGEMRLDGEPLRTYLGYLEPPGAAPFLGVVSLFPEDRIDVRIIRGATEVYGVFSLRRTR